MKKLVPALLLLALSSPASAHLSPEEHGSFMAGASHPWFGIDHILAMVAVGLWAASLGGSAMWKLPTAFVAAMVVGFFLALAGVGMPFVEPMILASVIVLGLVVATAVKMPVNACVALCALFGLFHGHAHGGELGTAGAAAFGVGFAISTALLHAAGVGIAVTASRQLKSLRATQLLGALTAIGGAWLAMG